MANTYRVQVLTKEFVKELNTEYSDAQYFEIPVDMTIEQFQKQNEDIINAEKSNRIANFIEAIKNPPIQEPPTKEELIAQQQSLIDQKAQIEALVADLDAQIAEKK